MTTLSERLRVRFTHLRSLVTRPLTLGVRGVVIDEQERVLLVRHGYMPGWHFPGGGVEAGETLLEALARELQEEARVKLEKPPALHGLFFKARPSRRDHVAVYVVRRFTILGERRPGLEIREARFFPRAQLPEGTTASTRARIAEIFEGSPVSACW
jgi:ADP-ribose pyrophosphatase YjhB (NUDIX family)